MFKLEILDLYYRKNRQVGHTISLLDGARSNKNILVVIANNTQKIYIDLPKEQFINVHNLDKLKGLNKPILIDHFAIQLMYWEMKKELDKKDEKIIELEAVNKILKKRIKIMNSMS